MRVDIEKEEAYDVYPNEGDREFTFRLVKDGVEAKDRMGIWVFTEDKSNFNGWKVVSRSGISVNNESDSVADNFTPLLNQAREALIDLLADKELLK